jgi:heavy metal sensor kinase
MTKSLRVQITGLYLLFFTAVFLLLGIFLYGLRARSEYRQLDKTLDAQVTTATVILQAEYAESGDAVRAARETVSEIRLRGSLAGIFQGGRLLAASSALPPPPLVRLGARASAAPGGDLLASVRLPGDQSDRVLARRVQVGGREVVVLAAQSLRTILEDLHLARRIFFITLPLVLLLVGAGGFLLTTRGLAPVRRMAAQAKTITDRNLRSGLNAGAATGELRVLADAFNELLARLDRSFSGMRRFVADASHELRTPLAVIRGEADVALSRERSASEYRQSILVMQDEARRLSRLVDDLLNLACADGQTTALHVEPLYLDDLLTECCRSVEALARSHQIQLACRCPRDVLFYGDQELLRRLVLNLLDNALRYTPAGGQVSVSLEDRDADLMVSVSDTGIGIPPEAAPHVFERFYRVDQARSRHQGGFGLGLSIVKWIAESHNGAVHLDSRPGGGSTFSVCLQKPPENPSGAAPRPPAEKNPASAAANPVRG